MSRDRALSPVLGVVALAALTVVLAAVLAAGAFAVAPPASVPTATFALSVEAGSDRIVLRHRGGDALRVAELAVRVSVDGRPLAHQPPVPFFAARGFRAGPTGPFNAAADGTWTAGERAGFALAGTNAPGIDPGDGVRVRLALDGRPVADLRAEATGPS